MARTLRPDDINPRTGLVVALVSVFLVFGFMFTVSGMKGETLGDIPLLAIGPAICLPGIAAIALTRKTDGCTKWPENMRPACCKRLMDRDVVELLRTPSDLESGQGSCEELAKKAYQKNRRVLRGEKNSVFVCTTTTATLGECSSLPKKAEQEDMLKYLETSYPQMLGNVCLGDSSMYSALEEKISSPSRDSPACPDVEDNIFVAPKGSIIVCSYKDNSPHDRSCCYINPTGINSDQESIV